MTDDTTTTTTTTTTTRSFTIPTTVLFNDDDYSATKPSFDETHATIALTPNEAQLFQVLLDTTNVYNNNTNNTNEAPLEIRVAGGWVRDKLLRLPTHDVDVAVSCAVSGVAFAQLVQTRMLLYNLEVTNMGIIQANPSQSKHLETATMRAFDIDVDICNLRAHEVYDEHSRIPTVTTHQTTPQQDAERRDFTVNALFYNLHSRTIEDHTGRGLRDLLRGRLVTPLAASRTFCDDPLRVLRAVRFSVRLQFVMENCIIKAAQDATTHAALQTKVSRERVGKEVEGMLSGKGANPVQALAMIGSLHLADCVFVVPQQQPYRGVLLGTEYSNLKNDAARKELRELAWNESQVLLSLLPRVMDQIPANDYTATTKIDHRILPLACFLLPFRHLTYDATSTKESLVTTYMMSEGIKFNNKDTQAMRTVMEYVDKMVPLLATVSTFSRLDAGLLVRATKELWVTILVLAAVLEMQRDNDTVGAVSTAYQTILDFNLDYCWNTRPLLDGKAVMQALSVRGPEVGQYLDEQVRWMLKHPKGTRDECQAYLLTVKESNALDDKDTSDESKRAFKRLHPETSAF
jgi:tRNA nucleotidyltransferase (CCA-adding enzyme)